MQMIQDGPYAHTPEKPLRMTGRADFCEVCVCVQKEWCVCVWEGEGEGEGGSVGRGGGGGSVGRGGGGGSVCSAQRVFCTESMIALF